MLRPDAFKLSALPPVQINLPISPRWQRNKCFYRHRNTCFSRRKCRRPNIPRTCVPEEAHAELPALAVPFCRGHCRRLSAAGPAGLQVQAPLVLERTAATNTQRPDMIRRDSPPTAPARSGSRWDPPPHTKFWLPSWPSLPSTFRD